MDNFNKAINSFIVNGNLDKNWLLNEVELYVTNSRNTYLNLLNMSVSDIDVAVQALVSALNDRLTNGKLSENDVKDGLKDMNIDYTEFLSPVVEYIKDVRSDYTNVQENLTENNHNVDDLIVDTINRVKQENLENGLVSEDEFVLQCYDMFRELSDNVDIPLNIKLDLQQYAKETYNNLINQDLLESSSSNKSKTNLSTDKYDITVVTDQPERNTYDSEEDYINDKKYYDNNEVFHIIDKTTGEEEVIFGEDELQQLINESKKMFNDLNESVSNTEESVSFQEIIEMMEEAESYSELYAAAQMIVDTKLETDVILAIRTCEDDGDDVDTAYSVVTSDMLDSLAMSGYKNIPNVYSQLDESKGTTKSFEDVLGLNPYDVNYENNTDALNIVNKFKAEHKLDDLFDYIVSITTHPFSSEQDYLDFLSVIDLSKLDSNNDTLNESSKNKDEDIINQLVNMGMTQDQARHTYKSLCNLFNNRIKSIDNNAELIEENLDDYKDKLSVEYMSKIFNQMKKNGWDGKPETVEKYFNDIISQIDPNYKSDKDQERESVEHSKFDKCQAVLPLDNYHSIGINLVDNGNLVQYMYSNGDDVFESPVEYDVQGNAYFTDEDGEIWYIRDFMINDDLFESKHIKTESNETYDNLEDIELYNDIIDEAKKAIESNTSLINSFWGDNSQTTDSYYNYMVDVCDTLDIDYDKIPDEGRSYIDSKLRDYFTGDFESMDEEDSEDSVLTLLQDRIGNPLSIGEFNSVLQAIFSKFDTVFLQANEIYNQNVDEPQEIVVWDDTDMYTITYNIVDQLEGTVEITDVVVE